MVKCRKFLTQSLNYAVARIEFSSQVSRFCQYSSERSEVSTRTYMASPEFQNAAFDYKVALALSFTSRYSSWLSSLCTSEPKPNSTHFTSLLSPHRWSLANSTCIWAVFGTWLLRYILHLLVTKKARKEIYENLLLTTTKLMSKVGS